MKKGILGMRIFIKAVAGLSLGATLLQGAALADTIVAVTEMSYDSNLRLECTAVRMNPATFTSAPGDACDLGTEGSFGEDRITKNYYGTDGKLIEIRRGKGSFNEGTPPVSNSRIYATYTYTKNGLKASEADGNGNVTRLVYDGFDRLEYVYYSNPSVSHSTQPCSVTPETWCNGINDYATRTNDTTYPRLGLVSATDYEKFGYDANSNRTSWRRRNGQTITYSYDNLNRETFQDVPAHLGGAYTATDKDLYTDYDLQGHILAKRFTSSTNAVGVFYAYDGLGRVTATTDSNSRTIAYQYNQASARTRLTYPDGYYIENAVDTLNRMTVAYRNGSTTMFSYTYDDLGRRKFLKRRSSATSGQTTYVYDNLGRLTSLTNDLGGTANDVTWTFSGRNPANQITAWGSSNLAYKYNEPVAPPADSRSYDGLNRDGTIVLMSGGYDANGNVGRDATRSMIYDIYNRLLSVGDVPVPPGTILPTPYLYMTYDAEGRLATYTVDGTKTEFLYDGTNLIGEFTHGSASNHTGDTWAYRYVHGAGVDEPIYWLTGSATATADMHFLISNYQGSIIASTDGSGVLQELYKYGPWGEPKTATDGDGWQSPHVRFGYTGQVYLGKPKLYYYKARIYDPMYGRFMQTDPIGSKDDLDLYAYVAGDPINQSDPTGTDCRSCDGAMYAFSRDPRIERLQKDAQQKAEKDAAPAAGIVVFGGAAIMGCMAGCPTLYLAASNPQNALIGASILNGIRGLFSGENAGETVLAREVGALSLSAQVESNGLTAAGRAVSKHPEYFGYETTEALQKANPETAGLNNLGQSLVDDALKNGTRTTGAGGRYPDGWITYTLPDGRAASWKTNGAFIGFRGTRK